MYWRSLFTQTWHVQVHVQHGFVRFASAWLDRMLPVGWCMDNLRCTALTFATQVAACIVEMGERLGTFATFVVEKRASFLAAAGLLCLSCALCLQCHFQHYYGARPGCTHIHVSGRSVNL